MNKWEITDNEMEGFVKSLFKDEENVAPTVAEEAKEEPI